jgi:predicted AAA+ superfamily ATPase
MELINRSIYVNKVLAYIGKGLIIVLTGQRRVGKSCILQYAVKEIKAKEPNANVIYINKEYAEFNAIKTDEQLNAYVDGKLKTDYHNYLFIDEIQDIDGFENSIRSLQAKNSCEIVITGSNAKMLSGELSTYLSGRYVEIHIQSLNYNEFIQFHHLQDSNDTLYQYLSFGGLPQLAHIGLDNRQMVLDYLGDVYNTVIMKDVISRENIRNVRFLNDLVRFVADNMGKNISANSISKFMKSQKIMASPTLVINYLGYLCNAYIVDLTPRFDIHGRKVFETNEKYYFEDIGLRNILTGINLRGDIEKLLENAVYLHLRNRGYQVTVGQLQKAEVDFVAEKNGTRQYIQVCYQLSAQETIEREFGNLRSIKDDYRKCVICMDDLAVHGEYNGIECMHIRDFLLSY